MITGIQNVHYYVQDMKTAVAFYAAAFKGDVLFSDEYWTSLKCHGLTIGLHGTGGKAVPRIPRDEHGVKAGGTLTFTSTNIPEDRAHLEKLGAKITGDFKAEWGHLLVFEDLDGNVLNLQHPSY